MLRPRPEDAPALRILAGFSVFRYCTGSFDSLANNVSASVTWERQWASQAGWMGLSFLTSSSRFAQFASSARCFSVTALRRRSMIAWEDLAGASIASASAQSPRSVPQASAISVRKPRTGNIVYIGSGAIWMTLQSSGWLTLAGNHGTAQSITRIASAALTQRLGLPPAYIGWRCGMATKRLLPNSTTGMAYSRPAPPAPA